MNPLSPTSGQISTVVIGYTRKAGVVFMPDMFKETPYNLTAFFDIVDSRKQYQYTPHNLAVVFDTLHPRPRAFVIGAAIPPPMANEMKPIWQSYVDNVLKKEFESDWEKNCIVSMPDWCYIDPATIADGKPPTDRGFQIETLRQLDAVFRPEKSSA